MKCNKDSFIFATFWLYFLLFWIWLTVKDAVRKKFDGKLMMTFSNNTIVADILGGNNYPAVADNILQRLCQDDLKALRSAIPRSFGPNCFTFARVRKLIGSLSLSQMGPAKLPKRQLSSSAPKSIPFIPQVKRSWNWKTKAIAFAVLAQLAFPFFCRLWVCCLFNFFWRRGKEEKKFIARQRASFMAEQKENTVWFRR